MDHIDPLKHSLCACRYWCGRGEADTQVGETAGVIPDEAVSIQSVEVVAAEIAVRHALPQNVPGRDQDGVADRNDGFLIAAASHAVILRRHVAIAARTAAEHIGGDVAK